MKTPEEIRAARDKLLDPPNDPAIGEDDTEFDFLAALDAMDGDDYWEMIDAGPYGATHWKQLSATIIDAHKTMLDENLTKRQQEIIVTDIFAKWHYVMMMKCQLFHNQNQD